MKAIVFDGKLRFLDDHPVPEPSGGEALIKVLMAGICNTDMEIIKGYMGFRGVIGHEFVGMVERVNGTDRSLTGKRVVGEINCGCGMCGYCLGGMRTHCPERSVLGILGRNGALAEYVTLPLENLHTVPEDVPDEEAVFTEPLAAAYEVLDQVCIRPTDKVLVMGDGKLGLLIALVQARTGAEVTLSGKHENKLNIAAVHGIQTVLLENLEEARRWNVVIDSTGSSYGFVSSLSRVKPRGTVVLKTTVKEGMEINLSPVVIDEVSVIGSRCGPFGPALRALSGRLVDVRPLITAVYGFDMAEEAFKKTKEKDSIKVLVDFR